MPRNEELIHDRMKKELCPICGGNRGKDQVLVVDPRYGEVFVCSKHIVQGEDKLVE